MSSRENFGNLITVLETIEEFLLYKPNTYRIKRNICNMFSKDKASDKRLFLKNFMSRITYPPNNPKELANYINNLESSLHLYLEAKGDIKYPNKKYKAIATTSPICDSTVLNLILHFWCNVYGLKSFNKKDVKLLAMELVYYLFDYMEITDIYRISFYWVDSNASLNEKFIQLDHLLKVIDPNKDVVVDRLDFIFKPAVNCEPFILDHALKFLTMLSIDNDLFENTKDKDLIISNFQERFANTIETVKEMESL